MKIKVTLSSFVMAVFLSFFFIPAALAATVVVDYTLPGDGFDSASPADGNSPAPGATLGEQRKASFQAAADFWGVNLTSLVPIIVDAQMVPLSCNSSSGTLGSAGATLIFRDFLNAPLPATWYHSGLANKLRGLDLSGANSDVGASFNSAIDNNNNCLNQTNWYYDVVPGAPVPNTISFFDVVLHEIGHGIGVSTFVDVSSGARAGNYNDIYMTFLEDHNLGGGTLWPAMSNAQRQASAIDGPRTHFTGPEVQAIVDSGCLSGGVNDGHAKVYAPNPLRQGSSISHWDTTTERDGISEIMEPFAVNGASFLLTFELLEDIGWGPVGPANSCAQRRRVFMIND